MGTTQESKSNYDYIAMDLADVQDAISQARVGDGDQVLNICQDIASILWHVNQRIADLEKKIEGESY